MGCCEYEYNVLARLMLNDCSSLFSAKIFHRQLRSLLRWTWLNPSSAGHIVMLGGESLLNRSECQCLSQHSLIGGHFYQWHHWIAQFSTFFPDNWERKASGFSPFCSIQRLYPLLSMLNTTWCIGTHCCLQLSSHQMQSLTDMPQATRIFSTWLHWRYTETIQGNVQ